MTSAQGDAGGFWSQMRAGLSLVDVKEGIVKSCIFGLACSLIAVYEGYYATPTAEGRASDDPNGSHLSRSRVVFRLFAYRRVFVGEHSGLTANFLHTKVYGTFMSKPLLHLFAAVFACHRRGARCDYLTQLSSVAGRLAIAKVDAK